MKVYILMSRYCSDEGCWDVVIKVFGDRLSAVAAEEYFAAAKEAAEAAYKKEYKAKNYGRASDVWDDAEADIIKTLGLEELTCMWRYTDWFVDDWEVS